MKHLLLSITLVFAAAILFAQDAYKIPFQGSLYENGAAYEGNATVTLTIPLDSASTWMETHDVFVSAGYYSLVLGEISELPRYLFDGITERSMNIQVMTDSTTEIVDLGEVMLYAPFQSQKSTFTKTFSSTGDLDPAVVVQVDGDVQRISDNGTPNDTTDDQFVNTVARGLYSLAASNGYNKGLVGEAISEPENDQFQMGVFGTSDGSGTGARYGVRGEASGSGTTFAAAVRGLNWVAGNTGGTYSGGDFSYNGNGNAEGSHYGVRGRAFGKGPGTGKYIGVYGSVVGNGDENYAGYFDGDLQVYGNNVLLGGRPWDGPDGVNLGTFELKGTVEAQPDENGFTYTLPSFRAAVYNDGAEQWSNLDMRIQGADGSYDRPMTDLRYMNFNGTGRMHFFSAMQEFYNNDNGTPTDSTDDFQDFYYPDRVVIGIDDDKGFIELKGGNGEYVRFDANGSDESGSSSSFTLNRDFDGQQMGNWISIDNGSQINVNGINGNLDPSDPSYYGGGVSLGTKFWEDPTNGQRGYLHLRGTTRPENYYGANLRFALEAVDQGDRDEAVFKMFGTALDSTAHSIPVLEMNSATDMQSGDTWSTLDLNQNGNPTISFDGFDGSAYFDGDVAVAGSLTVNGEDVLLGEASFPDSIGNNMDVEARPTLMLTQTGTNNGTKAAALEVYSDTDSTTSRGIYSRTEGVGTDDNITIWGHATGSTNTGIGVYGLTKLTDGGATGVYGVVDVSDNPSSNFDVGVRGVATGNLTTNFSVGVYGQNNVLGGSEAWGTGGFAGGEGANLAFRGRANSTDINTSEQYGAWLQANGAGSGDHFGSWNRAAGAGKNIGVYGTADSGTENWAGWFDGSVIVTEQLDVSNIQSSGDYWSMYAFGLNGNPEEAFNVVEINNGQNLGSGAGEVNLLANDGTVGVTMNGWGSAQFAGSIQTLGSDRIPSVSSFSTGNHGSI
ncbi:MAG: hypothetical protein ACO2ZZ_07585, partial [Cyclobacteriaceae bacterium]